MFRAHMTFDSFFVDDSNRLAAYGARTVASGSIDLLFIWGGAGTGKTHLLHAIGQATRQTAPNTRIFLPNDLVSLQAIVPDIADPVLVLIDDVASFLPSTADAADSLARVIDVVLNHGGKIALSATQGPRTFEAVSAKLCGQLTEGLIVQIRGQTEKTRRAMLDQRLSHVEPSPHPETIAQFARAARDGHEVGGLVARFLAELRLSFTEHEALQAAIGALKLAQKITVDRVQRAFAAHWHINVAVLRRASARSKPLVRQRQIAMYIARKYTGESYPELARRFGARDHTTVMSACKRAEDLLATDVQLQEDVAAVERKLR